MNKQLKLALGLIDKLQFMIREGIKAGTIPAGFCQHSAITSMPDLIKQMPAGGNYTSTLPTEEGYYWVTEDFTEIIVRIHVYGCKVKVQLQRDGPTYFIGLPRFANCRWSEHPIPKPEETK